MTKIHDSNYCNCEMCRFVEDSAKSGSKMPSKSSLGENKGSGVGQPAAKNVSEGQQSAAMALSADAFTSEWNLAPRSMRNYVEREVAEYWFMVGAQAECSRQLLLQNEDLRELLRVVQGRTA